MTSQDGIGERPSGSQPSANDRQNGSIVVTVRRPRFVWASVASSDDPARQTPTLKDGQQIAFFLLLAFVPSFFAALYFGLIAADRYVSVATFVVRNAERQQAQGGLSNLLQLAGIISTGKVDTYAVHDYITSRDVIPALNQRIDIKAVYGNQSADFLARYPSMRFGSTEEELHAYLQSMIEVSYAQNTGLSSLRVQAFTPEDSQNVAVALLDLGEATVNRINDRIQADTVVFSERQVAEAENRVKKGQVTLTQFRNRELTIDPQASAVVLTEVIGKLSQDLAEIQAQISDLEARSPASPLLPGLKRREQSLIAQIASERERISSDTDGLAIKVAEYESLKLEVDFAKKALAEALAAQTAAQAEARRQQLYLERIVSPGLPDRALEPRRIGGILTVFALNLLAVLVTWLLIAGAREHASTSSS